MNGPADLLPRIEKKKHPSPLASPLWGGRRTAGDPGGGSMAAGRVLQFSPTRTLLSQASTSPRGGGEMLKLTIHSNIFAHRGHTGKSQ